MLDSMVESHDNMPVPKAADRRHQGLKTGVIWAVLVATFVAIYSMLSNTPSAIGALKVVGGVVAVVAVVVFIVAIVSARGHRRTLTEINDADAALSRGQLAQANEALTRCCDSGN